MKYHECRLYALRGGGPSDAESDGEEIDDDDDDDDDEDSGSHYSLDKNSYLIMWNP
jgi:hypothetical protein